VNLELTGLGGDGATEGGRRSEAETNALPTELTGTRGDRALSREAGGLGGDQRAYPLRACTAGEGVTF
jgi:hypothetical protein